MTAIKIEHGIPVAVIARPLQESPLRDALQTMQAGDSFCWPKAKRNDVVYYAKMLKIKVVTRKISATEIRVWKT